MRFKLEIIAPLSRNLAIVISFFFFVLFVQIIIQANKKKIKKKIHLVHQFKLHRPEHGLAAQGPARVPDRLARQILPDIHTKPHPDIERVEIHMRGEELEPVHEIRAEHKLLAVLLALEVFAALRRAHTGLVRHEEGCVLIQVLAPVAQRGGHLVLCVVHSRYLGGRVGCCGPVAGGGGGGERSTVVECARVGSGVKV